VEDEGIQKRLVAIFAADVEGYSRLMGEDELGTLRALASCSNVLDASIASRRGRIANRAGDSVLAEFGTIADAVLCAMEIQDLLATAVEGIADGKRVRLRIGIHAGDVLVRDGDIFGEDVNIAARIQSLAEVGGVSVSRIIRDQLRDRLPLSFDDRGLHAVRNIQRPLRIFAVNRAQPSTVRPALELPSKPSIAVLPFDNLSHDPAHERLADGVVDEITAALSRVRSFFVIARSSTLTYKSRPTSPGQIGRELGVRYLIEGSLQIAGDRVRITAQLIDAASGNHIWANRFDGSLSNIFALQDRII
jgi:adenylate cyclase